MSASIPFRRLRLICSRENIFFNSWRKAATYNELFLSVLLGDLLHWVRSIAVNSTAQFVYFQGFLYHFLRIVSCFDKISCRCSSITTVIITIISCFYLFARCKNPQTPFCVFRTLFIDKKNVITFTACQRYFIENIYI